MTRFQILVLSLALVGAGAAHAETTPAPLLSRTELTAEQAKAETLRAAGAMQLSVEHDFAKAATGAFGVLCGRMPSAVRGGLADARGYDAQGKFLGAKLSFALR